MSVTDTDHGRLEEVSQFRYALVYYYHIYIFILFYFFAELLIFLFSREFSSGVSRSQLPTLIVQPPLV